MKSKEWLAESITFSPWYELKSHDEIMGSIYNDLDLQSKKQPQHNKRFLNNFITNLLIGYNHDQPIKISKSSKHYKIVGRYGLDWYSYNRFITIFNSMIENNYIELAKGFYSKKGSCYMTKMWATDKLIDLFTGELNININRNNEVIFMKDIDKVWVNYGDTSETNRIRKNLHIYNKLINDTIMKLDLNKLTLTEDDIKILKKAHLWYIEDKEKKFPCNTLIFKSLSYNQYSFNNSSSCPSNDTHRVSVITLYNNSLHRVFSRSKFNLGGRFYGGFYSGLSKNLRSCLTFNNEPTVELDFSGMHIRMLYHKLGIQFEGECYVYNKEDKTNRIMRQVIKTISLIAINSNSKNSAVKATNSELNYKRKHKIKYKDIPRGLPLSEIYDKFIKHHAPIKEFIASDIGIQLQYQDSVIMDNILYKLAENNITALPVHDSVIIAEKHKEELIEVMAKEYKKIMGFYPLIK